MNFKNPKIVMFNSYTVKPYPVIIFFLAAAIFFSPLEMYRIPVGYTALSISRFLIILLCVFVVFCLVSTSFKIHRSSLNGVLFLYLAVPLILTIPRFNNTEFLALILGAALIFIITHSSKTCKTHLILLRSFQYSYIWYIFFAIYSYLVFFQTGSPVTDIPFRDMLPFTLPEAGHLKKGFLVGAGGHMPIPRLALPFGTPPAASMALVIGVIVYLADKTLSLSRKGHIFRWIMVVALLLCVLATMSKSGFVVLVFSAFILCYFKIIKSGRINKKIFKCFIFLLFFFLFLFVLLPVEVVLLRLFDVDTMSNTVTRHFQTRVQALHIVFQNLQHLFLGVGFGNYGLYGEGPHSHSTYTTILVELGVLGSVFFWLLYAYTTITNFFCFRKYSRQRLGISDIQKTMVLGYLIGNIGILIGALVYDFILMWPVFVFLGLTNNAVLVLQRETALKISGVLQSSRRPATNAES